MRAATAGSSMLKFHARTDVGLKRKHNEDSLLAAEEFGVFVVADGVGGRKAGELASAITVNTFQSYAPQLKAALDAYASDQRRETRNNVLQMLDQAANAASRRVYEAATATGRQGMTTTLVAEDRGLVAGEASLRLVDAFVRRGDLPQALGAALSAKRAGDDATPLFASIT